MQLADLMYRELVKQIDITGEILASPGDKLAVLVPDVTGFDLLFNLVREKGYYWDKKTAQYISRWTGKPVKESTVRRAVEKFNSTFVNDNIQTHTDRFLQGKIQLQTWQRRVAYELKQGHIVNFTVGKGGRAQMTFSDWGKLGNALKNQYRYLNNFAQAIKNGQLTAGQIKYRVGLYSQSVRSSYFSGLTATKAASGYTLERRRTTASDPCDRCVDVETWGWQPIGTVPDPGTDCKGLTNCRCFKEYK